MCLFVHLSVLSFVQACTDTHTDILAANTLTELQTVEGGGGGGEGEGKEEEEEKEKEEEEEQEEEEEEKERRRRNSRGRQGLGNEVRAAVYFPNPMFLLGG